MSGRIPNHSPPHTPPSVAQGEVKLFLHLAREPAWMLHDATHTVVGGDSDLVLLALASPARRLRVSTNPRPPRGGLPSTFCCERFRARLAQPRRNHCPSVAKSGHAPAAAAAGASFGATAAEQEVATSGSCAALDSFVLLCLLTGNDYHKGLGCYRLPAAFAAWQQVSRESPASHLGRNQDRYVTFLSPR